MRASFLSKEITKPWVLKYAHFRTWRHNAVDSCSAFKIQDICGQVLIKTGVTDADFEIKKTCSRKAKFT
jgi:hypothetical protein